MQVTANMLANGGIFLMCLAAVALAWRIDRRDQAFHEQQMMHDQQVRDQAIQALLETKAEEMKNQMEEHEARLARIKWGGGKRSWEKTEER